MSERWGWGQGKEQVEDSPAQQKGASPGLGAVHSAPHRLRFPPAQLFGLVCLWGTEGEGQEEPPAQLGHT